MAGSLLRHAHAEWPDQVRCVYVLCHPEHEAGRMDRLTRHLVARGIPQERLRFCAPTWGATLDTDLIFRVYDPFLREIPFSFKATKLSKGEISLILNFYAAVSSAAKELSGNDVALVLESDVYLRKDFVARLRTTLMEADARRGWDYISLGDGVGTRPPGSPKSMFGPARIYEPPYQWVFRCTDSMLLSGRFINALTTTLIPFHDALDWEMNYQAMLHRASALWADPPLVEQGTVRGRDTTTLS